MSIIDFRVRPLYKHYEEGFDAQSINQSLEAFGFEPTESIRQRNLELLVEELDEAGIGKAVIPGRGIYETTNEELFEIAERYPDKFIIFPFLDVADVEQSLADIDKYVIYGKGKGVSIEPLVGNDVTFDDERIFPIYEKLEKNNIPVMATVSAWAGPYIDNTFPRQLDVLTTKFPELKFIAAHAVWPWFAEISTVAFKHPNLYLIADFESLRGAGSSIFKEGVRYMLKNQTIFASSYPLGPVDQVKQSLLDWNLPKDIEEKIFYDTAAKLLNL